MATHPFDKVTLKNGASVIFTPCPGVKEAPLQQSVATLADAGTNAVITLMFDSEIEQHGAQQLPNECASLGIKWFQLPIKDDASPDVHFMNAWVQNIEELTMVLNNQGTVAVHCKGGSGRTGLVIGLLMNQIGYTKAEAKALVQSIRPKSLCNPDQLSYFEQFE